MTQTMKILPMSTGSSLESLPVSQRTKAPMPRGTNSLIVCQQAKASSRAHNVETSRRNLMATTAVSLTASAAAGLLTLPNPAEAAKRKPPPPPEERPANDDKYLSAYDAKLLASQRRKDALKNLLEVQKKKAKNLGPELEENALEVAGRVTGDGED